MRWIIWMMWLVIGPAVTVMLWSQQSTGVDTNLRGVSIALTKNARGSKHAVAWVCGSNGAILKTTDNGKTWKRLHVAGGDALDFRGIQAFDEQTAYVMSAGNGDASRIYKTVDGGDTWKLQYTDKRKEFFLDDIACTSEKACFALSDPVDGKFLMVNTVDGEHWKELPRDSMPAALASEGAFAASSTSLALFGEKDIYIGTGGPAARVFHSPDLGKTWSVATTPILSGEASQGIFSIARRGNTVVVVGGDYKSPDKADRVAAYSSDGGATWKLAAQQPMGYRSAVAFVSDDMIVAVGPSGVDVSYDEGTHWAPSQKLNMNALAMGNGLVVLAVGPKGTVAWSGARASALSAPLDNSKFADVVGHDKK
jgi:photosystem II stability/assembly factor-like uncharacterized protein